MEKLLVQIPSLRGLWLALDQRCVALSIAIVSLGVLARLAQFSARRSFWHDEAFLVLNVLEKSPVELFGPLFTAYGPPQAAPPLFLLLQKTFLSVLGFSEYALRTVPLVCAILALALFARLALEMLRPAAALFATGLFAFSPMLIWHGSEAKPYAVDVFVAVLLLRLAVGVKAAAPASARFFRLAPGAGVALWFSYPAILVYAALSLALLPAVWREGKRARFHYTLGNAAVLASFALVYAITIRLQSHPALFGYWKDRFPDLAKPWTMLFWLPAQMVQLFDYPYAPLGGLLLCLAVIGGYYLHAGKNHEYLWLCAAPILVALAASLGQRYPFGGSRVTLFLAPFLFLLAGFGAERLLIARLARLRRGVIVVMILSLAWGVAQTGYHLIVPRSRSHIRPAVEYLRAHRRSGEPIYALTPAEFFCYWRGADDRSAVRPGALEPAPDRFWAVFAFSERRGMGQHRDWLTKARSVAVERGGFIGSGGAALLFERRPQPATTDP